MKPSLGIWLGLILLSSGCREVPKTQSGLVTMQFTVTGLDGNGVEEHKIKKHFEHTPGVQELTIDYLANAVVVTLDTTMLRVTEFKTAFASMPNNACIILEAKQIPKSTNPSPAAPKPDPAPEISDEVPIPPDNV